LARPCADDWLHSSHCGWAWPFAGDDACLPIALVLRATKGFASRLSSATCTRSQTPRWLRSGLRRVYVSKRGRGGWSAAVAPPRLDSPLVDRVAPGVHLGRPPHPEAPKRSAGPVLNPNTPL